MLLIRRLARMQVMGTQMLLQECKIKQLILQNNLALCFKVKHKPTL